MRFSLNISHLVLWGAAWLMALCSSAGYSVTWGIGGVVGPQSGLSLHRGADDDSAYHIVGRYSETDAYLSADYHKQFLSPLQWHGRFPLYLYGGLGLSGEHNAASKYGERFFLRLPLGAQWIVPTMHLQVFAETVGKLGEIPQTNISGEIRGGIRAYF